MVRVTPLTVFVSEMLLEKRKISVTKLYCYNLKRKSCKFKYLPNFFSITYSKEAVNDKSLCVSFNTLTLTTGIPVAFSL